MRLFLLDNHDSFTWNLAQYLEIAGASVQVALNDRVQVEQILAEGYDGIVLSPGPGRPQEAGITLDLIREAAGTLPILGVCLGHQALAVAWGADIVEVTPVHGKVSPIHHDGRGLFRDLECPFPATRYHSLAVDGGSLPPRFQVSARTAAGTIMGIRDLQAGMIGVQFHPESILTGEGMKFLGNFLRMVREWTVPPGPLRPEGCLADAECGKKTFSRGSREGTGKR